MKNTMKKPVYIPVEKLHPFEDHPYKVLDDDSMTELLDSIKEYGLLLRLRFDIENEHTHAVRLCCVCGHLHLFDSLYLVSLYDIEFSRINTRIDITVINKIIGNWQVFTSFLLRS